MEVCEKEKRKVTIEFIILILVFCTTLAYLLNF